MLNFLIYKIRLKIKKVILEKIQRKKKLKRLKKKLKNNNNKMKKMINKKINKMNNNQIKLNNNLQNREDFHLFHQFIVTYF